MTTMFYFHGFTVKENPQVSSTAKMLMKSYPGLLAPIINYMTPVKTQDMLVREVAYRTPTGEIPIIVASSAGGWFAERVAEVVGADLVLFNPSPNLHNRIREHFEHDPLPGEYAEAWMVNASERDPSRCNLAMRGDIRRTVILSIDDEVIDYRGSAEIYTNNARVIYTTGGHRAKIEHVAQIEDEINRFVFNPVST